VVLVAHGSARSGASAEPVLALARGLSRRGFPEVRTAFWKEEPFLHQALDATRSAQLVVLPVFLAEGYFSRVVVPRELGLRYGDNPLGRRSARLLPPLGADPALDALVLDRARGALPAGADPGGAALVVLGHGTPRDPGSADATLVVCARLRGSGFARVAPAFIDQEPALARVLAEAREPVVVVVPFLIAAGFHGGDTVPRELEAARAAGRADLPRVCYAEPIGTHPGLLDVVERSARAAAVHETPAAGDQAAPLAALEPALAERLARQGRLAFLQVEVRARDGGAAELRHVHDAGLPDDALRDVSDLDALAALARRDDAGGHRPLRTAADLRRGWRFRADGARTLVEALVALYGPAVVHWHVGERSPAALRAAEFAQVAARQTGIYGDLRQIEPAAIAEGIRRVCDGLPCLRTRLWGPPSARTTQDAQRAGLVVPCPAPCPILLAAVLEAAAPADAPE
jgi:sirohydrochlorin cobaltochelatase